jgi:plasmid maintenance system killer protein
MPHFLDERTKQIALTRFHATLPRKVSIAAHKRIHHLAASHSLQDVSVAGVIYRVKGERFALRVDGRWFITFEWDDDHGASSLLLERLKGS